MHPRDFCSSLRTSAGCSPVFLKYQKKNNNNLCNNVNNGSKCCPTHFDTASLLVPNRNHSWGHAVARVGAVSRGIVLQAGRSQVRFPMMLLGMRDQKVIGDYDVPGELRVLRLLGEDGVRRVTQLIKTYMKLESGPKISPKLQRVKSHKIQRPSYNQSYCNYRKYSSEDT